MNTESTIGSPWDGLYGGREARHRSATRPNRRATVAQRFKDLSRFVRECHAGLTPTERSVWFAVFTFTRNGRATVTQATLAKIGGVSTRSVRTAVRGLEQQELLTVLEQGRPGRSSVYRYRLGTGV
jgi:hypothetical protein